MNPIMRNILVEISAIAFMVMLNLAPYWQGGFSRELFMNATRRSAERDADMPTDYEQRRRYISRKLFRGSILFYAFVLLFLVRDIWKLIVLLSS